MVAFPVCAFVLSAAFAVATWRAARGPALRIWTIALVQFAVASAALAWGVAFGWTPAVYQTFYVFGAITNVGWLGLGTVWLLAPRAAAWLATGLVIAASGYALAVGFGEPLVAGAARTLESSRLPAPRAVVDGRVRVLSRWFSIGGSVVVIAGLVWSVIARRSRALGLGLLAAGVVVVGVAGELARTGRVAGFSVLLAAGIAVMYAGFRRTGR